MINMTPFAQKVILVAGILGVQYYGFSVIVLALIVFGILCIIDTMLWYCFAKSKGMVQSKTWQEWLTVKWVQFLLLTMFTILLGHGAYATDSEWIDAGASLLTMMACVGFCWGQLLSILENLAMWTHGSEQRVIKVVIGFLTRAFGIGEKIIEKKLNKYTIK